MEKMEKMEIYKLNLTFNGASPPPPPPARSKKPNFFLNAPSHISLPPKPHLRDPPISPYLERQRQSTAGDRAPHSADDSEISIFDAERYFKEGQDANETSKKLTVTLSPIAEKPDLSFRQPDSSASSLDGFGRNSRNRSFHAAPTVSSEASWNSQSGLLRNPPGSLSLSVRSFPPNEPKKSVSSPCRRLFRRSCPCSGRKSVDVEESYSDQKSPIRPSLDSTTRNKSLKAEREAEQITKVKVFTGVWPKEQEAFHFPPEKPFSSTGIARCTVNSGGFSFPVLAPSSKKEAAEEHPRNSLEVFQPSEGIASPALRKSADYQKLPALLLSGEERRSFNFTGSPKLRSAVDDDLASDTSSDLFEIESLSTQMACRRRESVDELSLLTMETKKVPGIIAHRRSIEEEASDCYAPSEVSVQWSVTTAEGCDRTSVANFSSAVSEFDELRYAAEAFAGEGRKKGIGGAGGLLSCRSQKAVRVVAPNLLRFGPEAPRRTGASVYAVEPDHVLGLVRLGAVNPVGAGMAGTRSVRMSRTV